MIKQILRLPAVRLASGLPRSSLYLCIKQGLWTSPVNLENRSVGWPSTEIDALNAARIAGKSNDEIRLLVKKLEAARKTCGEDHHG